MDNLEITYSLDSVVNQRLNKLGLETRERYYKLKLFRKKLASDFNCFLLANNLDELRDLTIIINDSIQRNQDLDKWVKDIFRAQEEADDIVNFVNWEELSQLNFQCAKDFEYVKRAIKSLRTLSNSQPNRHLGVAV